MNLKEFSEKIGLSQTTISRALGGYPEVNAKTRQRVEEAAKALNYRPNTRAKQLATGRAFSIGHLLPVSKEHEMVNPIFADFIAGAGEIYTQSGYDLHLSVVRDEDESKTYRNLARTGAVDGVVVHGPKINDSRIPLLLELGMPFVVHGRSSDISQDYSWIDVNNRSAFRRATDLLLDLGHERIALINGSSEMDFVMRRESGFRDAMNARGLAVDPALMTNAEMTEPYGHKTTLELMKGPNPPTALIVSSMIPAIGVRRALNDLGLKVGKDVSILIHDDYLSYFQNEGDIPFFTATRSSVRKAGRLTAEMLLAQVQGNDKTPKQVLLDAELIHGQSTGPLVA